MLNARNSILEILIVIGKSQLLGCDSERQQMGAIKGKESKYLK